MRAVLVMPLVGLLLGAAGPSLPDSELTPGAVRDDLPLSAICTTQWGKDERHVSAKLKREVFAAYGYPKGNQDQRCACEIDHLIPRELGGADDARNLWVQRYTGPWNAHMKDRLESKVHKLICTGAMPIAKARAAMASDWTRLYRDVYSEE